MVWQFSARFSKITSERIKYIFTEKSLFLVEYALWNRKNFGYMQILIFYRNVKKLCSNLLFEKFSELSSSIESNKKLLTHRVHDNVKVRQITIKISR